MRRKRSANYNPPTQLRRKFKPNLDDVMLVPASIGSLYHGNSKFFANKVFTFCSLLLDCPAVFGHFLDPPGNHPRGAIFPTVD